MRFIICTVMVLAVMVLTSGLCLAQRGGTMPDQICPGSEANVALVRGIYADYAAGNLTAMGARLDENVDWGFIGPASVPFYGMRHGRTAAVALMGSLNTYFTNDFFEVQQVIAAGDTVVVRGWKEGKLKPSTKPFSFPWTSVFTVSYGKVTRMTGWEDSEAMSHWNDPPPVQAP